MSHLVPLSTPIGIRDTSSLKNDDEKYSTGLFSLGDTGRVFTREFWKGDNKEENDLKRRLMERKRKEKMKAEVGEGREEMERALSSYGAGQVDGFDYELRGIDLENVEDQDFAQRVVSEGEDEGDDVMNEKGIKKERRKRLEGTKTDFLRDRLSRPNSVLPYGNFNHFSSFGDLPYIPSPPPSPFPPPPPSSLSTRPFDSSAEAAAVERVTDMISEEREVVEDILGTEKPFVHSKYSLQFLDLLPTIYHKFNVDLA
jgi:hypothetical protein